MSIRTGNLLTVGGALVCFGLALFLFFKPENSPISSSWMGEDGLHIYGPRGVSVYTFYVVWSADQRKSVMEADAAAQLIVRLGGMRVPPTTTLQERVSWNLRGTAFLFVAGLVILFVPRIARRLRVAPGRTAGDGSIPPADAATGRG